jgi:hypothetical protein
MWTVGLLQRLANRTQSHARRALAVGDRINNERPIAGQSTALTTLIFTLKIQTWEQSILRMGESSSYRWLGSRTTSCCSLSRKAPISCSNYCAAVTSCSSHRQPMRLPTTSPSSRSLISTDSLSHRQPTVAHRRRPSSARTTLRGCWERPSGVAFDCRLPCHGCCSFGNRERLVSVCGLDRGQP